MRCTPSQYFNSDVTIYGSVLTFCHSGIPGRASVELKGVSFLNHTARVRIKSRKLRAVLRASVRKARRSPSF